jgi:hypothetical protein
MRRQPTLGDIDALSSPDRTIRRRRVILRKHSLICAIGRLVPVVRDKLGYGQHWNAAMLF